MDSLNLSNIQNTEIDSRNIGSNTVPLACASCGCKDYVQTFSQANCFRTFHPVTPSTIQTSDNNEDKFSINQPLFSSPPLYQPFFNNPISPNYYFTHNNLNAFSYFNQIPEDSKQEKIENEKLLHPPCSIGGFLFFPIDVKPNCLMDLNKEAQKHHVITENTTQCKTRQNSESQTNPFIQICACSSTVPWNCSSFIVPIISYYVLWHSQNSNAIQPFSKSFSSKNENLLQKNSDSKISEFFSNSKNLKKNNESDLNSTPTKTEERECSQEKRNECFLEGNLEKREEKVNEQIQNNSSSFLSLNLLNSLNCHDENFCNIERKNELNIIMKTASEDSNLEKGISEENDSAVSYEKEMGEINIKNNCDTVNHIICDVDIKSDILLEATTNSKICTESKSDISISSAELQAHTFSVENENSPLEIQWQCMDIPSEGKNLPSTRNSKKHFVESNEEFKNQNEESVNFNKGLLCKKSIKNFTVTNQSCELSEQSTTEDSIAAAAAGDLGGINCMGYKMIISSHESEWPEKIQQDQQTKESLKAKGDSAEDFIEKSNDEIGQKHLVSKVRVLNENADVSFKSSRNFKSGIAKLSNNFKAKGLTPNDTSILTSETGEPQTKNSTAMKHRHNCLGENKIENFENFTKIQKTKTHPMIQDQISGPEKQSIKSKAANATSFLSKEEGKNSPKLLHHGNTRKIIKLINK